MKDAIIALLMYKSHLKDKIRKAVKYQDRKPLIKQRQIVGKEIDRLVAVVRIYDKAQNSHNKNYPSGGIISKSND